MTGTNAGGRNQSDFQDCWHPGRLWSLWDMLEVQALPFLNAINRISTLCAVIITHRKTNPDVEDSPLSDEHRKMFRRDLKNISAACDALNAHVCSKEALDLRKRMLKSPLNYKEAADETGRLLRLLRIELEKSRLFALEVENADFYARATEIFGEEVEAFPRALDDLEEAGKCLGLSRNTACVFHLMRAMELIVQDIGKEIGLTNVNKRWGFLLSDIDDLIKIMPKGERKELWSLARANLWHVKEVWRNKTMHPKDSYTGEQAREIVAAVKAFIRDLSGLTKDPSGEQSP